ncbi:hypothetical protein VYU27_010714, partial [Nannochloropsis oceanica]
KSLETEVHRLQKRAASTRSLPPPSRRGSASHLKGGGEEGKKEGDAFTPLERAIEEAKKMTQHEAVRLKALDSKAALEAFKLSKSWQAKLDQLQERRVIIGATPASFHWTVQKRTHKRVLPDVPLDKMEVVIHGGEEVLGPRKANKSDGSNEDVYVLFDVGFPK